jgi:arginyl-tRNA synthetase
VRCQSVIDKAEPNPFLFNENIVGFNQEEMAILRTVYRFPEIVKQAGNSFSPNLICNFAFDLAQKYNIFYEKNSIIKAGNNERRDFRLSLTMATRQILENSLKLLGISIPEKM